MKWDLILGWQVEEKKLEAKLDYKIVGDGAISKNLQCCWRLQQLGNYGGAIVTNNQI